LVRFKAPFALNEGDAKADDPANGGGHGQDESEYLDPIPLPVLNTRKLAAEAAELIIKTQCTK